MHFTRIGGRAREKAEKALGANGADGIINIEGKIARVGNERVSIFNVRAFHDAVLELGSVPLPLSPRGSTASSPKTAEVLTRI
jgi:hypothetical protein